MKIRITLTEEVLGSSPSNEELLASYIASKAPTDDLTAQEVDNIKAQAAEERTTMLVVKLALTADLVLLLAALGSMNIPVTILALLALNLLCGMYFKEVSRHENV